MSDLDEDFASMFEASFQAKRIEKGQTVDGTIVGFGHDVAFVNVGGKGEAVIDLAELRDADGALEVAVGETVHALVISTEGGLTLSRRLARGAATDRQLEDAYQAGLPVQGKVEREVKGGYEVRLGRSRGFCPFSQIDIVRGTDPAQHIGQVYSFRITEYKEGGRNLIVSRRALLEEEQRASAVEVRKTIVPGATLTGRVASVRDFGAFIDLGGGIQGLLHVSEMGWSRVSDPSQVAKPGESITVKVLRVDDQTEKISLGLKQLLDDPWASVPASYEVGQLRTGRVTRVTDFGAFVELEPGVEGLAHSSTFAPTGHSKGWAKSVAAGTTGTFEILSIDIEKKRIGVALVEDGVERPTGAAAGAQGIAPGVRLTGKVERHEKFGVFVFLAPGRTGLMPLSETGLAREADVARAFPVGSPVEVVVLDVAEGGRRIRVSRKAVQDAQEADEMREYSARADTAPDGGFGSLADKLRGALRPSGS
ncbi:MAG TPA: S1 RNA-binding domain-containing protein [Vicinamibacterales bacterium]|nr:S1 RNA-binding domain-containing protein [Vicinamibacterales bacterium]